MKHTSKGSNLALKPSAEITTSPKQEQQWPQKRDSYPPEFFLERFATCILSNALSITGIGDGWNLTVLDTEDEYEFVKQGLKGFGTFRQPDQYLIGGSPFPNEIRQPPRLYNYNGYSTQSSGKNYFIQPNIN